MTSFSIFILLSIASSVTDAQDHPLPYPPPSQHIIHPLPHTYLTSEELPLNFTWQNVNGHSYLTRMKNQHIPQYCGSGWAHAALSVLADRLKIMRSYIGPKKNCKKQLKLRTDTEIKREEETKKDMLRLTLGRLGPPPGPDFDLSVQYLLNCGPDTTEPHRGLSCHGGSSLRAYEYIHSTLKFIPEDSCLNYIACSSESQEGWCPQVKHLTTCDPWNVCRTCDSFSSDGVAGRLTEGGVEVDGRGETKEKDEYGCKAVPRESIPNVTILEYGSIEPLNIHAILAEIYARYGFNDWFSTSWVGMTNSFSLIS